MKMDDLGKKSVLRNKIIADMFYRADHIERMGTGIGKIRTAMAKAGLEPPVFESTAFFTVTFKRPKLYDEPKAVGEPLGLPAGLTENENMVFEIIKENEDITIMDIAEHLGVSRSTVKRIIKSLNKKGIIMRVGSDKKGYWKFI